MTNKQRLSKKYTIVFIHKLPGSFIIYPKKNYMNNLFKTLIAGYGAKKLGGGCLSTVIIFIVIWWALGHCS